MKDSQESFNRAPASAEARRSFLVRLQALAEPDYAAFKAKLIPSLPAERVLGVRAPKLRALAKNLRQNEPEAVGAYLAEPIHDYLEEYELHSHLLDSLPDWQSLRPALEAILPAFDNWLLADGLAPALFKRIMRADPKGEGSAAVALYQWLLAGLASPDLYWRRFAICRLMAHFSKSAFRAEIPAMVARLPQADYYEKMVVAWYFAELLAWQEAAALPYFQPGRLPEWTRLKAIAKACESFKIRAELKTQLKSLR